jgi:hypothetical protein
MLVIVDLTNRSAVVALATQVVLRSVSTKARVLPAYASDNFVSLLPGEKRQLTIEVPASAIKGEMEIALTGWNLKDAGGKDR